MSDHNTDISDAIKVPGSEEFNADDNPGGRCDWHEEKHGDEVRSICFRGITKHKEE